MTTIRDHILDAFVALLNGTGKPSGLVVSRMQIAPKEESDIFSIVVRPERESIQRTEGRQRSYPIRERTLTVKLECRAKCAANQSADEALDPLLVWITKSLAVDQTFARYAVESDEEEITWEGANADSTFGLALVTYGVNYITNRADQEKTR
jgi:hypothetical protein